MPFTPAHVVAAVPLAPHLGRSGIVSALAIGAMTPDLAYFMALGIPRWESHSIAGLLWFCLPVGLAAWLVFVTSVAPLLHDVAPRSLRARLPAAWATGAWPAGQIKSAALCVVIGAVTHLVWDSFTHVGTPLAHAFPNPARRIGEIGGYTVRPISLLQHASTLLGFTLLAVWGRRWWTTTTPDASAPMRPLALRLLLVALVFAPALWLGGEAAIMRFGWPREPMVKLQNAATGLVFTGGTVFFWSLALVSVAWRGARALPSRRALGERVEAS